MVLLEGTNLSEGRGTTRPFEMFGAPYLDPNELVENLGAIELPGVVFRPCCYEPTFQKHAGQVCGGAQIHVVDRSAFRPIATAVSILRAVKQLAPENFDWLSPPYEYEHEKMPMDILWGSELLRTTIDSERLPSDLLEKSESDLLEFEGLAEQYLLYA
jgi:uncharacterized protein YbbC (DUF1343 family)